MKNSNAQRLADAKAELEQINGAISAILSGAQGYRMGSRSLQRADLATLYKRKDTLNDLIAGLEGGSGSVRRVVPVG